jgi:hypothetical protein
VDYAEIWRLSTNYYIDDFVMNLIYTLGIPAFTQPPEGSIVMGVSTKKAVKQPQKGQMTLYNISGFGLNLVQIIQI